MADVVVEGQGHLVAGQGRRPVGEHAAGAEGGHLRRAPADVDHEVRAGLQRIDAAADGAADRLRKQMGAADAGLLGRFEEGAALQRRGPGRDTDHD